MQTVDVIIVGGGPAGSSCAWQLKRHNVDCLILDKATFPRTKLCAGWITPEVVDDLEIDIKQYPHRFLTFDDLKFHFPLLSIRTASVQHSIRRYEFDAWLLERSGAKIIEHNVRDIQYTNNEYIIDGQYRSRYLIGAGGTRCPVYRQLFRDANPRPKTLQAVTLEEEFAYDYPDPQCHLWFFKNGLPGYAWYVPKADGYINVGIGGMAQKLKNNNDDIKPHWQQFIKHLAKTGLITKHSYQPKGYSYFIRDKVEQTRIDNAFIIGDAAGLATRDMCEGIGPAVKSGLFAANSIIHNRPYNLETIAKYSSHSFFVQKLMEYKFHRIKPNP